MNNKSTSFFACICVALGYIIFGLSYLFTANLLKTTSVFDAIALRFLISTLFLTILCITGIIKVNFKNKSLKFLFLTALFEPVFYFIFETFGIKYTTTTIAGMIIAFTPAIAAIAETIILKEKTTFLQKVFLIMSITGVAIVSLYSKNDGKNTAFGIICLLITAVCGALFIVSSRKISSDFSPMEITYFSSILGAVVFNAICVAIHVSDGSLTSYFAPLKSIDNLVGLLFLSIVSSFVATTLINFGTSKLQASSVSSFSGISTVTTIVTGVMFNGEVLKLFHIISVVLILTGVIGMNYIKIKSAENKCESISDDIK